MLLALALVGTLVLSFPLAHHRNNHCWGTHLPRTTHESRSIARSRETRSTEHDTSVFRVARAAASRPDTRSTTQMPTTYVTQTQSRQIMHVYGARPEHRHHECKTVSSLLAYIVCIACLHFGAASIPTLFPRSILLPRVPVSWTHREGACASMTTCASMAESNPSAPALSLDHQIANAPDRWAATRRFGGTTE